MSLSDLTSIPDSAQRQRLASPSTISSGSGTGSLTLAFQEPGGDDTIFRIYLMDESVRQLKFGSGRTTRASDILSNILRILKVDDKSAPLFALWMVGDDLQLQLKANHEPVVLREQWTKMLERFCAAAPTESPKLVLKRDAFVLKAMERKVRDEMTLELLFDEARYNVIYSKYPASVDDCCYLAGILLQLFVLESPASTGEEIIRTKLARLVPEEQINSLKEDEWRTRILKAHQPHGKNPKNILYLLYLQYVWQWPFYGATFFGGEYRPLTQGVVVGDANLTQVRVGVNAESLVIINDNTNEIEHKFEFHEISWDSVAKDGRNYFLIEFGPDKDPETIVIVSPMAQLMDSMVTRAVEEANRRQELLLTTRLNQGGPQDMPVASIETGLSQADRFRKPKFRSLKKIFL